MTFVSSRWLAVSALALALVVLVCAAVGVSTAQPRASAAAGPQKTVKARRLTRRPNTLAPGSSVSSADLGQRVFTDAKHGFALASSGQAQYPAASGDGGKTWVTDGPALHLDAAQAPLVVLNIGAAGRRTIFAYGGGQVVDTTSDGGGHWYQALFNGLVMAEVRNSLGHLVAFVDGSTNASGSSGVTWQYVSKNGGRTWSYDTSTGGS